MTKEVIKERYEKLKELYLKLRKELKETKDPVMEYEIRGELSNLSIELASIRRMLMDQAFGKWYIGKHLEKFFFEEDGINKSGRRKK